ncbi:glycosyl hydrolase 3 family protein [Abortiporus biennis]
MAVSIAFLFSTLIPAFLPVANAYGFPDCQSGPLKNNTVCDTTKDPITRAKALIDLFTVDELVENTDNGSPGVPRLGLPAYQWWSEGLHGVASSPGVNFSTSGQFNSATSFPQPILMGATFDDELIQEVATVVSTEARAFNNVGRAGLDFWTPNINPFKDPRWGRGQETPGEDPFHLSRYVFNLIQGLQGGLDPKPYFKVVADCKHFAAYDMDNWEGFVRYGFNAVVTPQDLSEYYLPPFQTCVRDAKVGSVMCSYNAVNGIPSCASSYLLQTILRDYWGFSDDRWVTSDCDAVGNIFSPHNYTPNAIEASASALKAGTDIDCGTTYGQNLGAALNQSLVSVDDLKLALSRQYASLVRLGYFDSAESQPFRQLGWSDVNTKSAQDLAYKAAVEGIVLLKNDGTLPLKKSVKNVALIGPWANATTLMQGNYAGVAPFLISPVQGAQAAGLTVSYAMGTGMATNDSSGFAAAISTAKAADVIVYAGGLDLTVEKEELDRVEISWPGNQLDLITQLSQLGKPFIVAQFGGGQVDDSALKSSKSVNAILWGGYPGQSGGQVLFDIITGKAAPSGRLPTTQYPANYVNQVPMTDMTLRPSSTNPGRTYKWFSGTPVFEFGFGLHFTTFSFSWATRPQSVFNIQTILRKAASSSSPVDLVNLTTVSVNVRNTGKVTSDYVALLFLSGKFGPAPNPNKSLISYTRLHSVSSGKTVQAKLPISLGSIARADDSGNLWIHPGTYQLTLDTPGKLSLSFRLQGIASQITEWPQDESSSA